MKTQRVLVAVSVLALMLALSAGLIQAGEPAQDPVPLGTAFTYQGQLRQGGDPVNGTCDFQFGLWDAATVGTQVGITQTKTGVSVSNGLFSVLLDFGAAAFGGDARWLEVSVRSPAGSGDYTTLSPRQALTAVPYALYARNAWSLTGNAGTTSGTNFLGTTDNEALELKVNNARVLRLEPNATGPNVIGGYGGNSAAAGVYGATIGGGGGYWEWWDYVEPMPNVVSGNYATVGGGALNTASGHAAVVGGGGGRYVLGTTPMPISLGNTASGDYATVGGGQYNSASGGASVVAGGGGVMVQRSGGLFMLGNRAVGDYAAVSGGARNEAREKGASVGGGFCNEATGVGAVVSGGGGYYYDPWYENVIHPAGNAANGSYSTVGGGASNIASGYAAVVGGGLDYGPDGYSRVGNTASSACATVGGGLANHADGITATISGGEYISVTGKAATVAGGSHITVSGDYATVPGGEGNTAQGDYSFAAGRRAKANDDGSFVWADSTDADFASTAQDQFAVRAAGGVTFDVGSAGFAVSGGSLSGAGLAVSNSGTGSGVQGSSYAGSGVTGDSGGTYGGYFTGASGVYGSSDTSDGYGGYFKSTSGKAVQADGDVQIDGDLTVTGQVSGFPRPNFDSGWVSVTSGGSVTITHNLGGDPEDYVVDMTFRDNVFGSGIHQITYGGDVRPGSEYKGMWWERLDTTSIMILRSSEDVRCQDVRIRIWVYK